MRSVPHTVHGSIRRTSIGNMYSSTFAPVPFLNSPSSGAKNAEECASEQGKAIEQEMQANSVCAHRGMARLRSQGWR